MEKEKLEQLFEGLQGKFDVEEPQDGHQDRFLEKLKELNDNTSTKKKDGIVWMSTKRSKWYYISGIAASVLFLFVVLSVANFGNSNVKEQVVEIAPEVSQTEFYFASLIEEHVELLQSERSPETTKLIDDTLSQLKKLENDYNGLEQALLNGGDSKFILHAMITNFQTRIDLLKDVLNNINAIKNLKNNDDENFTI